MVPNESPEDDSTQLKRSRKPHSEETKRKIRESNLGKKRTQETRDKVKEARKKQVFSEETRQKLSEQRKGRKHSEETKHKIAKANQRRVWSEESKQKLREANLGKKHTEASLQKMSEAHQGQVREPHSEETRQKISEALKGKPSSKKGIPVSEEQKHKQSEAMKGRKLTEEQKRKIGEHSRGRVKSEAERQKLREARKDWKNSPEAIEKMRTAKRGKKLSEEHKQKIKDSMLIRGEDPDYRAKVSEGVKKAFEDPAFRENNLRHITSPEMQAKATAAKADKPFTEERKAHLAETSRKAKTEYWEGKTYEERLEITRKAIEASQNIRVSSLELRAQKMLDEMGFQYEPQKQIGAYYIDFYLPEINVILNIHGCYWHGCPECNLTTDIKQTEKKRKYDHKRDAQLRAMGYEIITIWEHDLVEDVG